MARKTYSFTKFANHGTSNPIVARLGVQTSQLIEWSNVTKEKKIEITTAYIDMQQRLLGCYEIEQRLVNAYNTTVSEAEVAAKNGSFSVPNVIGLQHEIEGFLYATKAYIREIAMLVNMLFQANLKHEAAVFWNSKGNDSDVLKWAKGHFGETHETTKMLATEANWIGEVVRKRNAIEHPGGRSGNLIIENFNAVGSELVPPLWSRDGPNGSAPSSIYADLSTIMSNLLTFTEDLLIEAIRYTSVFPALRFYMVPEAERDPQMPVRIRATIDLESLR